MMAMCSKLLYFLYPRHHIRMGVSGNMAISSPLALMASLTIYPESKCTNDDDTELGPAQLTNHEYRKLICGSTPHV